MSRKRGQKRIEDETNSATRQAISMWVGQFNVSDIKQAVNDLLEADGIQAVHQSTYNRIRAMVKKGEVKEVRVGKRVAGYIKAADTNNEKLVNVSKPVKATKITFLEEENLSPRQVCKQLEKWMLSRIKEVEGVQDLKHDAEQMYTMQERVNELIHQLQRERDEHKDAIDVLKVEHKKLIDIARNRYNELNDKYKVIRSKFDSIMRVMKGGKS